MEVYMKIVLNGRGFQFVLYWNSVKSVVAALTSVLRLVIPFITVLLTLLAAPEIHRLIAILSGS